MLSISTIVTLKLLFRFQIRRRRNQTTPTLIYPIRNILFEWEHRRSVSENKPDSATIFDYSKSLLHRIDLHTCYNIQHNYDSEIATIQEKYFNQERPVELFEPLPHDHLPEDRLPAPGITFTGLRYHPTPSGTLNIDDKLLPLPADSDLAFTSLSSTQLDYVDLSGSPPIPEICQIIHDWFPCYDQFLHEYCRPPSFGPQAFADFNRPTPKPAPPSPERHEAIMSIVRLKMGIKPFRPLHFADALAAETPLSTSASYYSKLNPRTRVLARYCSPSRYVDKPTSKGYHINVMLNEFRLEYHHIKYDGYPFPLQARSEPELHSHLEFWLALHPAQLFIRTQISKRDPSQPKKIRPVYSVDDRFLHIEKTLTVPALAQLRNPQSCVAHGLETFRGSMALLNRVAYNFASFISLDWSQFDQRLPAYVILAFYLDYLASLLIVSHGYMPTRTYPNTTQPIASFASKIFNLLIFLTSWYLSMTFLSYDGFAYKRLHGGVPSGLLNTQLLDSFGNMYIIVDCLLEFGFTDEECLAMLFCVLGDDNLIFLRHNIERVTRFMSFLDTYCLQRHGMVLSVLKSVYSNLRTKLTFLSYENSNGMPTREIGKLVAQLAMPERPIPPTRQWIHAARALGLAYANCGQDIVFHLLCEKVYQRFRPSGPVPSHQITKIFRKWKHELPEFDIESAEYTFPSFPSLYEIRQLVHEYHGPFSETDKWNFHVFTVPPSDNLTEYVTLKDYMLTNSHMSSTVHAFWHGKRSI